MIAAALWVPFESETVRAIRKFIGMGTEGVDFLSAFLPVQIF